MTEEEYENTKKEIQIHLLVESFTARIAGM